VPLVGEIRPLDPPVPPSAPAPSKHPEESPVSHPDPSVPHFRPTGRGSLVHLPIDETA